MSNPPGQFRLCELPPRSAEEILRKDGIGIRIGPFNAHIRISVPHVLTPFRRFYANHPLIEGESVFNFRAELRQVGGLKKLKSRRVRFLVDGIRPQDDMPVDQALPVLEWGINLVIALRHYAYLMFHCAALERNGFVLLLPAAPGHGKSTLCAGLAFSGWRLFSDEFGLVQPGSKTLFPMPRPIALKDRSIDVIRSFTGQAKIGPATPNTRKGTVAHVAPPPESVRRQQTGAEVKWIIFPQWLPGANVHFEAIDKSEAFMRLALNAFNYESLGELAFTTVRSIIDNSDCYRFCYSDLGDAIEAITELADADIA